MEQYYGEQGRRDADECYRSEARNIGYMAERYPLTLLAIENALGVVVHTRETFDSLATNPRAPLVYAPLPFSIKTTETQQSKPDRLDRLID